MYPDSAFVLPVQAVALLQAVTSRRGRACGLVSPKAQLSSCPVTRRRSSAELLL